MHGPVGNTGVINSLEKGTGRPAETKPDFYRFTIKCVEDAVVKPKYRKMFEDLITLTPSLKFINLGFTDLEVYNNRHS